MIGTTVSRYRIVAKLGGGGMGVVYDAEDTELGRHVAIKFLPEEAVASPDALERFKREARAASALEHPNICTVFDVGVHESKPFLVMERLKGRSLKDAIGSAGMPIDQVVKLGEQIADALDAAHRAGIVHRDLKPANLFVTGRGDAKILDFGLAKMTSTGNEVFTSDGITVAGEFLTEVGTTLGTVAYMSPEQARGQIVDARSDLFSLGVVLYEMATGKLPFSGATTADLLASILRSEPTLPRELNPQVPVRLEDEILKALEKDPALRYQSAAEMRADLLRSKRDASVEQLASARHAADGDEKRSSKGKESPGARREVWISVAAGALISLASVGYLVLRPSRSGSREFAPAPGQAASATSPSATATASDRSIAVLPFVNMSEDQANEYFSDGISEELLNLLAKIPELKVTARTSSFTFKGKNVEIPEIARQLGVGHILEGSVRKSGDRVRITANLVDADGHQAWSETYDRRFDDLFAIQDEIAAGVVKELEVRLLGRLPTSRRIDAEAFALFLQAEHLGDRMTPEAIEESDALYRRVLQAEPRYAAAHDGLAANALNRMSLGLVPGAVGFARAREESVLAVAIDPEYSPAYTRLGLIAMFGGGDLASAASYLERALALHPSDLSALDTGAALFEALDRVDEARELREALVLHDPLSLTVRSNLALVQRLSGRYEDAITSYRTLLSLSPGRDGAHCGLGVALLLNGDPSAALEELGRETNEAWRLVGLGLVYHGLGRKADSDRAIAELIARYQQVAPYNIAHNYAYRGDADLAFEWLEKAIELQDGGLRGIAGENLFDAIHSDPRWLPFLRKIGRAPEQLAKIKFDVKLPKEVAASR